MTIVAALSLGSTALPGVETPDTVDLRLDKAPLLELVQDLAEASQVGLVADESVVDRLASKHSIYAKDVPWADALTLLESEYRLTITMADGMMVVSDAREVFRERLELRFYDVRHLLNGTTQFPGALPDDAGTVSNATLIMPEIADEDPPEMGALMELLMTVVDPESWDEDGVAIDEWQGQLAVVHVPEAHEAIAATLLRLEALRTRSVVATVWRAPIGAVGDATVIDGEAAKAVIGDLGQAIGVVILGDGQRNHHFAGTLRWRTTGMGKSAETFIPERTLTAEGLAVDLETVVTIGGVVVTSRISDRSSTEERSRSLSVGEHQLPEVALRDVAFADLRDSRLVPAGGAAVYRMGAEALIIRFDVLQALEK
jgi:hypothetical protein